MAWVFEEKYDSNSKQDTPLHYFPPDVTITVSLTKKASILSSNISTFSDSFVQPKPSPLTTIAKFYTYFQKGGILGNTIMKGQGPLF